ncbi:holdfast anchoring protein HfaB [Candidatus Viadribacter manganicus]|uniref:Transcriptional regulator n=1 Tax=Candidatus Viadribacter manganicus TaxID=1759059 RepID=A0A1B1ALU8_9PROT|nr:holdfast anchoring protein HfaB [Candidatus Viadribacter manganicus]ANP47505.1 transcriptional regulator [Candidatus Viadribacter manganicus]
MRALKTLAVLAATTALTACVTPHSGNDGMYALPIGDAPVTANPTAYTPALDCLNAYARGNNVAAPRIAVGRILDYTGSVSEEGGRRITQGASLMAMSAFNKAGARLVERFDTSVTELELRYANNRLIGQEGDENVRRIYAGQMPGSDYYFVGGITELNYNIRSMGVDAQGGHTDARDGVGNLGGRLYVMNIALDFRLIDTRTLEVVDVISYQKQIIGRELRAGVFSFFDDTIIDIAAGERALEPVQLAVRAGVERAVVEVMSRFYNVRDSAVCAAAIQAEGDPMGPGAVQTANSTQSPATAAIEQARTSPDTWNARRDDNFTGLRGRS